MTIQAKIYLVVFLCFFLGGTLLALSFFGINRTSEIGSKQLMDRLIEGEKEKLQAHTFAMSHAIEAAIGPLEDQESKVEAIRKMVSDYRFEEDHSGYFFVYRGTEVVVLPPKPALEGKDLGNTTDPNGVEFVRELSRAAASGGGFVAYEFDKPGAGLQPKLAFSKRIEGSDMWMGTGIYIDNLEHEQAVALEATAKRIRPIKRSSVIAAVLLIGIIGSIAIVINRGIHKTLAHAIKELENGSAEIRAASQEVASTSQALAEQSTNQASSIQSTQQALEDVTSTVRSTRAQAGETSTVSLEVDGQIGKGGQFVSDLRKEVDSMTRVSEEMQDAMSAIKDSSHAVGKIIKTIDEIAFQTNILALNAAVEAARAGDAGAGFAVVAEEVRSLASRTADAARETTGIISQSIERSEHGFKTNTEVGRRLEAVEENSGHLETILNQITERMSKVTNLMREVDGASETQSLRVEEINGRITEIADSTQEGAASAEESAAAAEELNAQTESLNELVHLLGSMISRTKKA